MKQSNFFSFAIRFILNVFSFYLKLFLLQDHFIVLMVMTTEPLQALHTEYVIQKEKKDDVKTYSAILYFTKGVTDYVFIVILHVLQLFVALHFAAERDMMRVGIYIRRAIT